MARVTWFEYFADDAQKDVAFYEEVFGWEIQRWGDMPYWLVVTGDPPEAGIDGAIGPPPMSDMTQRVVTTVSVDDNDETVAKAVAAGGTVVMPKRAVPGSGWLTYVADPAGIIFGVMQYSDEAK